METRSWINVLELLRTDERLRSEIEGAAQRGVEPLIAAFQAVAGRVGEQPSRAEVVDLLRVSARVQQSSQGELQDEELERVTGGTSEDEQLANVDLQPLLQRPQMIVQMLSNVSKSSYDTAQAVIRKIGS